MTKINCIYCSNLLFVDGDYYCKAYENDDDQHSLEQIDDIDTTPPWCPLKDKEKTE